MRAERLGELAPFGTRRVLKLKPLCEVFMPASYLSEDMQRLYWQWSGCGRFLRRTTRVSTDPSLQRPYNLCWHLEVAEEAV
jgi:hypothetical protein